MSRSDLLGLLGVVILLLVYGAWLWKTSQDEWLWRGRYDEAKQQELWDGFAEHLPPISDNAVAPTDIAADAVTGFSEEDWAKVAEALREDRS